MGKTGRHGHGVDHSPQAQGIRTADKVIRDLLHKHDTQRDEDHYAKAALELGVSFQDLMAYFRTVEACGSYRPSSLDRASEAALTRHATIELVS